MNWQLIGSITVTVILLILVWYKGKKQFIYNLIYSLMESAEHFLGSKEGKKKLEVVLDAYITKVSSMNYFLKIV